MGHVIAVSPVEIFADTSKKLKKEKKSDRGSSSAAATPAPNGNLKSFSKN